MTFRRSSSHESACVKMLSVRHSAQYPPSASCTTSNTNSSIRTIIAGVLMPDVWEEWFGFPAMRMVYGRFPLSEKPGLGFELSEASLAKYPFGGTRPMARVFHDDGSVAEW